MNRPVVETVGKGPVIALYLSNGERRTAGKFDAATGTLISRRQYSKHYFRIHDGWGIAKEVLSMPELKKVVIIDTQFKRRYESPVSRILEKGKTVQYDKFEEQVVLKNELWNLVSYKCPTTTK